MAILHDATLQPTKLEVLAAWVPQQPWYPGDAPDFEVLGRFRFDDPAGAVGIETYLLGLPDGTVVHVPMTYRDGPLDEPGAVQISTLEHSVLGTRWVYDAATDPVYRAVVADVIRTGGREAAQFVQRADGTTAEVPSAAHAQGHPGGSGAAVRVVRTPQPATGEPAGTLTATWDGGPAVVLVET